MHYKNHKTQCEQIQKQNFSVEDLIKYFDIKTNFKFTQQSQFGLTGLMNLGNTCFMNSALQCLSNVSPLTEFFLTNKYIKDLNLDNPIGTGGWLAHFYAELIKEMWMGSQRSLSCWNFKKAIAKLAPQFYGSNQQDAQELLQYLLDGLHEDLNLVKQKPAVPPVEYEKNDQISSKLAWEAYQKRNQSKIVDLLSGQFKSTLVCPICNKISITFDPYFTVSLPIPNNKLIEFQYYFVFKDSSQTPLQIKQNLPNDMTAGQFKKKLCEGMRQYKLNPDFIDINLMKQHIVKETAQDYHTIKQINDSDGAVFVQETYNPIFDFNLNYSEIKFNVIAEVQIKGLSGQRTSNYKHVSFSRSHMFSPLLQFYQLHLQIYKQMRFYLKKFFLKQKTLFLEKIQNFDQIFNFDLVTMEFSQLQIEYEKIFKKKIQNQNEIQKNKNDEQSEMDPPYDLYIIQSNNIVEFPYSQQKFLDLINTKNSKQENIHISLQIILAEYLKLDELKLNNCVDHHIPSQEKNKFDIYDCFDLFTKEETLDKDNEWYCSRCQKHVQATKKMEIYKAPQVLILHLKRFKTAGIANFGKYYFSHGGTKISTVIDFPLNELNLEKYILCKNSNRPIYDLVGVSNHFGNMGGGHYTAYAKNQKFQKWYDFDDQSVSQIHHPNQIVSEASYLLFYTLKNSDEDFSDRSLLMNQVVSTRDSDQNYQRNQYNNQGYGDSDDDSSDD